MTSFYIAFTYDVCEHNNLYEEMNEYPLDPTMDLDMQVKKLAKLDIAPLIKVYKSNTSDYKELSLYKEYTFEEYECGCQF